jgi:cytosine/uracil/thiamine/allantoin permease
MDPVPPHLRTWSTWNYIAYWISDATNVAMWQLASSMLAIGLTWYVTWLKYTPHFPQYHSTGDRL